MKKTDGPKIKAKRVVPGANVTVTADGVDRIAYVISCKQYVKVCYENGGVDVVARDQVTIN